MLVRKTLVTLQHPSEPETQVVARLPLTAGDMAGLRSDGVTMAITFELLASVVQSWTYDDPPSVETMRDLDPVTYAWLVKEIFAASNLGDDQKKASASGSAPTSLPAGPSPSSSAT